MYAIGYSLLVGLLLWLGSSTTVLGLPSPTGANQPPVAVATSTTLAGSSPLSVTFTGSKSYDPDGDPITYLWDFGDGTTSTQANPVHVFTQTRGRQGIIVQSYTAKLTVSDNKGGISVSTNFFVSIPNTAPTARISNPANNDKYVLDKATIYTAAATVTDELPNDLTYAWTAKLRRNNRNMLVKTAGGAKPNFDILPIGCDGEDSYYVISLKVTDLGGLSSTVDSVKIYPDCSKPTLNVAALTATPISSTSVRLNWTNPSVTFDDVLVVGKAGAGFTEIPNSATYATSNSFTATNTALFGGKALYQGTSTSLVVTDLTPGQTYYFRVYTRKGTAPSTGAVWNAGIEVNTKSSAVNRPPVVVATSTSLSGTSPLSVTFTGDKSSDPDGDQLFYEWAFSDGTYLNVANPVKVFTTQTGPHGSGTINNFTGQLTVTDSKGQRSTSQVFYISLQKANQAPVAVATSTSLSGTSPLSVTFTGDKSSDPDGDPITYEWDFGDESIYGTEANPVHVFSAKPAKNGIGQILNYTVRLTVIDNKGLRSSVQSFYVSLTPTGSVLSVEPDKCYRIVSRVSGKVLGVEGSSLEDGALVRQRTDASQQSQRWRFEATNNGYYKIGAVHSNKVIDVLWGSQQNGAALQQWTFNGNWSYNQHFALQRNASGYFQIAARHSGKALEVQNGNSDEGGLVVQNAPNGGNNQQWLIEERACSTTTSPPSSTTTAPPSTPVASIDPAKCYKIQSRSSGLVLNVPNGSYDDGVNLRQNANTDQAWQKWRLIPTDGGFYKMVVLHNQKGIQVPGSSTADDVLLEQWTYWGGNHQQWAVQRNADGFYTFSNRNSNKAVTVRNASTIDGAAITQQTLGTGQNQQWSVSETTCPAGARSGIDEVSATFSLWPNPASDHVLIDLRSALGQPVGLQLNDISGRPVQQKQVDVATEEPYRLNLGQLPNGLYLMQIKPAGQSPATLRLLIQR
ncbi:hypothetical protein GCM10027592_41980 [Spirosoma flavus]